MGEEQSGKLTAEQTAKWKHVYPCVLAEIAAPESTLLDRTGDATGEDLVSETVNSGAGVSNTV